MTFAPGFAMASVEGAGVEAPPDWGNLKSPENHVGLCFLSLQCRLAESAFSDQRVRSEGTPAVAFFGTSNVTVPLSTGW